MPSVEALALPPEDLRSIASQVLGRPVDSVTRAGGGGNSRIYRVEAGDESYALKMYPTIARDVRDRLGVEKKTLQFFERHGVGSVPRWLGDQPGYALLSWVEGELANPPHAHEIDEAIAFLANIRRLSDLDGADDMPQASEACISGAEVCRQIDARLARLMTRTGSEPELKAFLQAQAIPAYHTARDAAERAYGGSGIAFAGRLADGYSLIPADFGFHNAMRGPDGRVTFIDFEYFGWDDPVKLTADFLLHPAMNLPRDQQARFYRALCELHSSDRHFALRLRALTPLFAMRWSLILLNEFLPERWSGRAFAKGADTWEAAKSRQLGKAVFMLKHCTDEYAYD